MRRDIFVFGSNLAGRHGKGAALEAIKHWGAIYGQGVGLQGNSYAIPTKDHALRTLPLDVINGYVKTFLKYADFQSSRDRTMHFNVTALGTGLAGYSVEDIAPMFRLGLKLDNISLCDVFQEYLQNEQLK